MKKILIISCLVVLCLALLNTKIKNDRIETEKALVENYVVCLNEHFTQRQSCASKLDKNYHYLDALIKKYGYDYKQIGKDLQVYKKQ